MNDIPFGEITGAGATTIAFMWLVRELNRRLDRSETRETTLEERIATLERRLARAVAREFVSLENVAILRRALIEAGIAVPTLRDMPRYEDDERESEVILTRAEPADSS